MTPRAGFTLPDLPAFEQLDGYGARFVLWRWQERNGKPDKPPLRVNGQLADSTKPSTWGTLEKCREALAAIAATGIGFVLAAERDVATGKAAIVGIDLD